MSEGNVDLSQIRGDWKFHIDYVQNAIDRTLERLAKTWAGLGNDSEVDAAVNQQIKLWSELKADVNDKGTIPTADVRLDTFIAACRDAKPLCDAYEERDESENVEEFAEACRQARAMCDDLEMMKGQRPDDQ